jgi:hypothetical protein
LWLSIYLNLDVPKKKMMMTQNSAVKRKTYLWSLNLELTESLIVKSKKKFKRVLSHWKMTDLISQAWAENQLKNVSNYLTKMKKKKSSYYSMMMKALMSAKMILMTQKTRLPRRRRGKRNSKRFKSGHLLMVSK